MGLYHTATSCSTGESCEEAHTPSTPCRYVTTLTHQLMFYCSNTDTNKIRDNISHDLESRGREYSSTEIAVHQSLFPASYKIQNLKNNFFSKVKAVSGPWTYQILKRHKEIWGLEIQLVAKKKKSFLYGKCDSNVSAGIKNVWNFTSKPTIQIHAAPIRHFSFTKNNESIFLQLLGQYPLHGAFQKLRNKIYVHQQS
jgi:hypothetical protein